MLLLINENLVIKEIFQIYFKIDNNAKIIAIKIKLIYQFN